MFRTSEGSSLGCDGGRVSNYKLPIDCSEGIFPHRPSCISMPGRYVSLEPLRLEHVPVLWALACDQPESACWLPTAPFKDFSFFKTYAKLLMSGQNEIVWSVCLRGDDGSVGAPSGWAALLDVDIMNATIELGNIWFPKPLSRSRGGTEALTLLLGLVFDELGYQNMTWKCETRNVASARCAGRLGFSPAAAPPEHDIMQHRLPGWSYYNLRREDWRTRRAALHEWLSPVNFDHQGNQLRPLARTV